MTITVDRQGRRRRRSRSRARRSGSRRARSLPGSGSRSSPAWGSRSRPSAGSTSAEIEPHFEMYVTPLNIDPEKPALPISHPFYLFRLPRQAPRELHHPGRGQRHLGPQRRRPQRTGLPGAHLLQPRRMGSHGLQRHGQDEEGPRLLRLRDDGQHPAHVPPLSRQGASRRSGRPGQDEPARSSRTSTSGWTTWSAASGRSSTRRASSSSCPTTASSRSAAGVNLNSWLWRNGYLTLKEGRTDERRMVQGRRLGPERRPTPSGSAGVYLNLKGREAKGIVGPGAEAEALKAELIGKLSAASRTPKRDHGHQPGSTIPAAIYAGPYKDNAPDLIIGYSEGYRASWDSVTGKVNATIFEDNTKAWGGDHCIDPKVVPGVLFSSLPLTEDSPSIMDIAPTVLELFGLKPPASMDGRRSSDSADPFRRKDRTHDGPQGIPEDSAWGPRPRSPSAGTRGGLVIRAAGTKATTAQGPRPRLRRDGPAPRPGLDGRRKASRLSGSSPPRADSAPSGRASRPRAPSPGRTSSPGRIRAATASSISSTATPKPISRPSPRPPRPERRRPSGSGRHPSPVRRHSGRTSGAGRAFWQILEEHDIPATIFKMPANYPPVATKQRTLSGMGTPDIKGYLRHSSTTTRTNTRELTQEAGGGGRDPRGLRHRQPGRGQAPRPEQQLPQGEPRNGRRFQGLHRPRRIPWPRSSSRTRSSSSGRRNGAAGRGSASASSRPRASAGSACSTSRRSGPSSSSTSARSTSIRRIRPCRSRPRSPTPRSSPEGSGPSSPRACRPIRAPWTTRSWTRANSWHRTTWSSRRAWPCTRTSCGGSIRALLFFYFSSTDQRQHMFWRLLDTSHPAYDADARLEVRERHREHLHARWTRSWPRPWTGWTRTRRSSSCPTTASTLSAAASTSTPGSRKTATTPLIDPTKAGGDRPVRELGLVPEPGLRDRPQRALHQPARPGEGGHRRRRRRNGQPDPGDRPEARGASRIPRPGNRSSSKPISPGMSIRVLMWIRLPTSSSVSTANYRISWKSPLGELPEGHPRGQHPEMERRPHVRGRTSSRASSLSNRTDPGGIPRPLRPDGDDPGRLRDRKAGGYDRPERIF